MKRNNNRSTYFINILNLLASCLALILVTTSVFAKERGDATVSENEITISENDFKRMILEGQKESPKKDLILGEHLWKAPQVEHREEFLILKIPVSSGFKGSKIDHLGKIFSDQKQKK